MLNKQQIERPVIEFLGCYFLILLATIDYNFQFSQLRSKVIENSIIHLFLLLCFYWIARKNQAYSFNMLLSILAFFDNKISFVVLLVNLFFQSCGVVLAFYTRKILDLQSFLWISSFPEDKFFIIEFLGAFMLTLGFSLINQRKSDDGLFAYILAGSTMIMILCFGQVYYSRYNLTLFLLPALLSGEVESQTFFSVIVSHMLGSFCAYFLSKFISIEQKNLTEDLNEPVEA